MRPLTIRTALAIRRYLTWAYLLESILAAGREAARKLHDHGPDHTGASSGRLESF